MSIPPLLSRSPPPICETSDEDDDAFGAFLVESELAVDVSEGGVILEDYAEKTVASRCEDTTSEDSGLCMGSVGQNQSPCDTSPVSSTYVQTIAIDIRYDCDKSDISCPSLETKSFDEKLSHETTKNYIEDCKSCTDLIREDDEPDVKADILGPCTYCNDSSVEAGTSLSEEVHSAGSSNEHWDEHLMSAKNSDKEATIIEDTSHIPFEKQILESCDPNSFIAQVDEFIESESADFDDFQEFQSELNEIEEENHNSFIISDINIQETQSAEPDTKASAKASCDTLKNSTDLIVDHKDSSCSRDVQALTEASTVLDRDYFDSSFDSCSYISLTNTNSSAPSSKCESGKVTVAPVDDDFSDFADFQSSANITGFGGRTSHLTQNIEVKPWSHWWPESAASPVCTLHLNDELQGSKIWCHLRELDSSPALMYQWSSSLSNCKLLSALNIDSRNILLGPWNKYKFSTGEGFSCDLFKKPVLGDKNDCLDESGTMKGPVPDAHFDWVGSGLVNPLDCVGTTLLDLQLLTFSHAPSDKAPPAALLLSACDRGFSNDPPSKETSSSKIVHEKLQTLPDISFMRKSFIVFPKCMT